MEWPGNKPEASPLLTRISNLKSALCRGKSPLVLCYDSLVEKSQQRAVSARQGRALAVGCRGPPVGDSLAKSWCTVSFTRLRICWETKCLTSWQCHWLQNVNEHSSRSYSILALSPEKARVVLPMHPSTSTVVNNLNGCFSKEKDPAKWERQTEPQFYTLSVFCKKSQVEAELQGANQMSLTLSVCFLLVILSARGSLRL